MMHVEYNQEQIEQDPGMLSYYTGQKIERIRQELGIPSYHMCDILAIGTASEYYLVKMGAIDLDVYQKIMFVAITRHPLE